MIKRIFIAVLVIGLVGAMCWYFPIDFLRGPAERALSRGLGRKVEVGKVYLNLFGFPGITLDQVTIHEDPRAGIEPFAYVESLDASLNWLRLYHSLEFSSLNLGDATINLVKTPDGPWNFQYLLVAATGNPSLGVPSIRMRGGRVNFKFGDTKSIMYVDDADLDVAPSRDGTVGLRFGGAPARTNSSGRDFGRFYVRGNWNTNGAQQLNVKVELERSSLDEVSRLFDPRGFGLHGIVALDAQLTGPPSALSVEGELQVEDVHRWDLLPESGSGWRTAYRGKLDLRNETLEFASTQDVPDPPFAIQFRAAGLLSSPRWETSLSIRKVPAATLLEIARHMGAPLGDKLSAQGSVSGALHYAPENGLTGQVELSDASLSLPGAQALRTERAALSIEEDLVRLDSSTVRAGESEAAEVEGSYSLRPPAGLDLKISTRGLDAGALRSFGLALPIIDQTPEGSWRGWVRYHEGEWLGEYDLLNARIPVDGLAAPLRIQSAGVSLAGPRTAVNRIRAKIGEIPFTGDYRWEPGAARPDKFHLSIGPTGSADLLAALAPTLSRQGGFLARTLRLAPEPMPDWLRERHAEGTLSIAGLSIGDSKVRLDQAGVIWDGGSIRLLNVSARIDQSAAAGTLAISLEGPEPKYRFEGKILDVPYKGGKLDFEGSAEAAGQGPALLESLRAEGRVRGRAIVFAPDAEFRTASAAFDMRGTWPNSRWKLSGVEVTQNGETFLGSGASQAEGKLALDLAAKGAKPVRLIGTPVAAAPPAQP